MSYLYNNVECLIRMLYLYKNVVFFYIILLYKSLSFGWSWNKEKIVLHYKPEPMSNEIVFMIRKEVDCEYNTALSYIH
jgi:hypothetical protein